MLDGITDLLRILVFGPSIILLTLFGLACTLEGWRHGPMSRKLRGTSNTDDRGRRASQLATCAFDFRDRLRPRSRSASRKWSYAARS
jgi:hypothetical protein